VYPGLLQNADLVPPSLFSLIMQPYAHIAIGIIEAEASSKVDSVVAQNTPTLRDNRLDIRMSYHTTCCSLCCQKERVKEI